MPRKKKCFDRYRREDGSYGCAYRDATGMCDLCGEPTVYIRGSESLDIACRGVPSKEAPKTKSKGEIRANGGLRIEVPIVWSAGD